LDNQAKLTPRNTDILKNGKILPIEVLIPPNLDMSEPAAKESKPEEDAKVKPPLKIALIGTAPSSRNLAPFNDPSWTIWACSPGNAHGVLPRVDAWFEIHSNLLWPECISYGGPYVEWLKKQTFPIYMQNKSVVPNAIPLPIDELTKEYGKYFFTSSFAYMIAMAIKYGAAEIALFGIDMASKDEYILQRPGGHFFMQEAAKRGIKVSIPFESDLGQPPALYGYSDSTPFGRKMHVREQELKQRVEAMRAERDKLNHSITFLEGALEDVDYIKGIWSGVQT
jgi:hypothetical protein